MKRMQGIGSVIVLALVLAASQPAWSQTAWTNAVSGYWKDAANWSNGVPNLNDARLTAGGGSYTVTVDEPPVNPFRGLTVTNTAAFQTTLDIAAAGFASVTGQITIGRSGVVNVNPGGEWTYRETNRTYAPMFLTRDGGRLNIAGGSLLLTNLPYAAPANSSIYVGEASAGSLYVSAGRLEFWNRTVSANGTHQLIVGRPGGAGYMEISGGTVILAQPVAGQSTMIVGSGAGSTGTLAISGGQLIRTNAQWNGFYVAASGGYGTMYVTNTGYADCPDRCFFGYGAGGRGYVTVGDSAVAWFGSMYLGSTGGTGTCTVVGGLCIGQGGISVGMADGVGLVNVYGGTLMVRDAYGFKVGCCESAGKSRGTLHMTNGAVFSTGYNQAGHPLNGLMVGRAQSGGSTYGEANISGGWITNDGQFAVGVCMDTNSSATGVVNQAGGYFQQTQWQPSTIGWNGGNGTYNMYGGTFYGKGIFCVGGIATNFYSYNVSLYTNLSVGLLNIQGGSFIVSNTVYVGAAGTGKLVVGPGGLLRCKDLVLTNAAASTLRLEVGSDGAVGQLVITNKLTVLPGAKLEVYVPKNLVDVPTMTLTLATYRTNIGSFAEVDVTVSNYPIAAVTQTATNIQVLITRRPRGTMMIVK